MLTLTLRHTGMLTLGLAAFALAGHTTGAQADSLVSHTQSTVQVGAPQAQTVTRTDTIVDPQGKLEGAIVHETTTIPAEQYQSRRTTTLNPDGSLETRAQASRTIYDAEGNLVTTSKSSVQSQDGVTVLPHAVMTPEGEIEVYTRTEPSASSHTIIRTHQSGAWHTGGNFNE